MSTATTSIFTQILSTATRSFGAVVGFSLVGFWLVMAVIGPFVSPHDANAFVSYDVFGPMTSEFPLGSDYLGRDMLSRILHGTPYTIGVALMATVSACVAGVVSGLIAAANSGWIDATISRTQDALISIPSKMFALIMVASFGSSVPLLIITAAIAYMPGSFRIARSLAVNVMTLDFIQVARLRGESTPYIIFKEVLPNMFRPVLTDFGLRFVFIVLLLSSMSFLGLGIQPPEADWGSLVRENILGLGEGAPAVVAPAVAIATLTIGVNLLIDSLGVKPDHEKEH
ncbi:ABC transporter permease [Marinomonas mediterranea]|jgi:ABC-type dipeptide/oligopeptide/nickel transport systems, permease components|uniref:ABC-type transporter, integral membrane subunit n=1 Tax=Marinomonas mediterranea (strain ATCC 700492 / JCM 21426 / NBRC 103028 / MMB-1) TaxID=717774 RepID=F2JVQ6_MARM1|nr:ABC transporter permease [Marinomonas mediterranea]ADZ91692.1 ABC-type transporter, integral membrane subunit [Marinomonas mediterranea MMB-1]WCN17788.1 ABC transporter permease subunit [Marinomonas mediterranea MMB-1]